MPNITMLDIEEEIMRVQLARTAGDTYFANLRSTRAMKQGLDEETIMQILLILSIGLLFLILSAFGPHPRPLSIPFPRLRGKGMGWGMGVHRRLISWFLKWVLVGRKWGI